MRYLQEASKKVKDNQLKKLQIKKATKIKVDGYRIKKMHLSHLGKTSTKRTGFNPYSY